jgi:putative NADH-flavin reductase
LFLEFRIGTFSLQGLIKYYSSNPSFSPSSPSSNLIDFLRYLDIFTTPPQLPLKIPIPRPKKKVHEQVEMHFLILGGSGQTGKLIISEALSRNHTITALVRKLDAIPPRPGLTLIAGTPLSLPDLTTAFDAHPVDGVIVALASLRASSSPFSKPTSSPTFMYDAHVNLVSAATAAGVKRIATMQSFGGGSSSAQMFWLMRAVMQYSGMAVGVRDHEAVESYMRGQKGVEWTGVRACMLAEGDSKDVKTWGDDGKGIVGLMPKVTKKSVACFLVDCMGEEGKDWIGKTPVISN